jgi:alkylation response protein AidB-like acyl-CoA dehydrogenase
MDTRSELMNAVDRVEAVVLAHANQAQDLGTLAEPAWQALHDHGLFRLKAPRDAGGHEADPVTQIEVFERVASIDSSAGWTLFVGAGNVAMLSGWLPDEGLADVLVDGRLPRVASGIVPSGTAVPTSDGYVLNGRWQFGSGSGHAEWLSGNAFVQGAEPPTVLGCAFPRADVTIHPDSWEVGGLKGTGSYEFSVADLFVPGSHTFDVSTPPHRGGALFQIPLPGFVAMEHGAFAVGVARRAIDEMSELAKSKVRGYITPQGVAARSSFQLELGRTDLALRAARAGLISAYNDAWAAVTSGEPCDVAMQTQLRCAAVYATDVAIDACRTMFRYAGAKSLFSGNIIERCLRDVTAAGQHAMVSDAAYESRGQVLLGLSGAVALT